MDSKDLGLYVALFLSANSVLLKANPAISDFFSSNLVVFLLTAVVVNKVSVDKNILNTLAISFLVVIIVKIITIQDFKNLLEPFELIYPGPNSSPSCLNITKENLIEPYGDENKLKKSMVESGVPMNMELNDVNAPEIATYLINNKSLAEFAPCKLN